MRQDPQGPWSPGIALIRWPNSHSRWEAKVAILYPDRDSLLKDFDRSARWKRVPGVASRTHSLRLEKSRDGVPWISFGVRHYLPDPLTGTSPDGNVQERPEDRISVRVFWGGINRMKAIKRMDEVEELTVIFNTFDEDGPDDLENQARRLGTDHLGYMAGTEPIRLSGLFTLGHLALTKSYRARLAGRRPLKRFIPQ